MTDENMNGLLYRTYSEVDLFQLRKINELLGTEELDKEIIDTETLLSTYEGHTIFSIYFYHSKVYEMILKHWQEKDLGNKEDDSMSDEARLELRRLYRVLMMPVVDMKAPEKSNEAQCLLGFRSVMNKSIRDRTDRGTVRNILFKLAHMCPENDIKSFVENQNDMNYLLESLTPDVQHLLEDAFSETIYTQTIKRAQWDPKEQISCFMAEDSIINEKKVNEEINKG